MSLTEDARAWWTSVLLDQEESVHPVFGTSVSAKVEGNAVILTGTVQSAKDAEEIEAEARSLEFVDTVINELQIGSRTAPSHLQTVVAVYPHIEAARFAARTVEGASLRAITDPEVLADAKVADARLRELAEAACILPDEAVERFIGGSSPGVAFLIARTSEDEVFRIISSLEGTHADRIETLPPEPKAMTTDQAQ